MIVLIVSVVITNMLLADLIILAQSLGATDVRGVYEYGSHVYGTNDEDSDQDFIIISNAPIDSYEPYVDEKGRDISFYGIAEFDLMLDNHYLPAIECISQLDPLFAAPYEFDLNLQSLRIEVSYRASNSWSKARKKLTVGSIVPHENDRRLGLKSLFHVHRMISYGIQIAQHGLIIDFACSNWFWDEIKEFKGTWEELDKKYRVMLNELRSDFKKVAPKEVK